MTELTPWHDPVVAELHATRDRLAEQYHHDLFAYTAAAEARCRALGLNMVEDPHLIAQVARSALEMTCPALQATEAARKSVQGVDF
jgi:hypothetical protein